MSTIAPSPPVTPAQPITTAPQPTPPPADGAVKPQVQAPTPEAAPSSPLADTPEPAVVTGARTTAPQAPQPTSLAPGTVVTATLEQAPPTPPVVTTTETPEAPPAPPPLVAEEAPTTQAQTRPATTTPQPAQTPTTTTTPTPASPAPLPTATLPSTPLPSGQSPAPLPQPTTPAPLPTTSPAPTPLPTSTPALATLLNATPQPTPSVPAAPQAAPPPAPGTPTAPAQPQLPAPGPTAGQVIASSPPAATAPATPPTAQAPAVLATVVRAAPVVQTSAPPPAPAPLPTATAQPAATPGAPAPAASTATAAAVTPLASGSSSAESGPRQQGVGPDGGNTGQGVRTPASATTPRPGIAATATSPNPAQVAPTPTGGQASTGASAPLGGAPVLALRPGTALLLQVTEMTPRVPGAATPQQPMTLTAQGGMVSFGATVMGSTIAGQPIVETPLGLFTLGAKVALPEGTQLQLRVMQPPGSAGATGQAMGQPATLMELSHQWAALDEALATLRAIDPKAAQAVLDQTIAKPGPQLAGGLAFFLTALRGGGDLKRWLGESSVQALEKSGRGKLIQRLSEEMREMSKAGAPDAAPSSEWRPMFMPVFDGEGIRQLRLFVHRDANDADDDAPPGKRFLVEADFTRLGQFQLDGLVQPKKLDLVVRTKQALPGEVTQNINAIFTRSLDAAGFAGKLRFESGVKMVTPDPEAMYGHAPGVSA